MGTFTSSPAVASTRLPTCAIASRGYGRACVSVCACLRMRRRCARTGAQLLRIAVRGAIRMSVQVDTAADGEPKTAGRQGRNVHTATVRLFADGRQALARRLGFYSRIALRARLAGQGADEHCAQAGPLWLWLERHDALSRRWHGSAAEMQRVLRAMRTSRTYRPAER